MRRRSRSEAPPQTPCSIRCWSAYSRHSAFTVHIAHTRCAASTPKPSDGKNSVGLAPRQRPCIIQAYCSGTSSTASSLAFEPTARACHRFDVSMIVLPYRVLDVQSCPVDAGILEFFVEESLWVPGEFL